MELSGLQQGRAEPRHVTLQPEQSGEHRRQRRQALQAVPVPGRGKDRRPISEVRLQLPTGKLRDRWQLRLAPGPHAHHGGGRFEPQPELRHGQLRGQQLAWHHDQGLHGLAAGASISAFGSFPTSCPHARGSPT
ncbi:hypothetical protein ACRAWD_18995 [Caulobacter segnis]